MGVTLKRELSSLIVGQEENLKTISAAIAAQDNPTIFIAGPAATGKTEAAKAIATCAGVPLFERDMGSYRSAPDLARLLGASGVLQDVAKAGEAVLVLDALDQAGSETLAIVGEILLTKKLALNDGTVADFSNVVVVALAHDETVLQRMAAAVGRDVVKNYDPQKIDQWRRGQFFDVQTVFEPLSVKDVEAMLLQRVERLSERLLNPPQDATFHLSDAALRALVSHAAEGAEPQQSSTLVRHADWLLTDKVIAPLLRRAFNKKDGFDGCKDVCIDYKDEKFGFHDPRTKQFCALTP